MRTRLIAAFAAVYIIWGSTYLAMRFAIETLPPFLMLGARFLIAGTIMLLWARWRDGAVPTRRDATTGAVSGTLMLACGNGSVVWAVQRVPSGIAALIVAVVPVWMVLLDWLRPGGHRPRGAVFAGLALGIAGLLMLVGRSSFDGTAGIDLVSTAVLLAGSLCWALASIYTQHVPRKTSGSVGAAVQMLAGGTVLTLTALLLREPSHMDLAHASARSLGAMAYLVVFGSLVGFTAYLYMLAHTTAARAATYAYVNPVVAVLLGWLFAHEAVTARTALAAAVILVGVATITLARDDKEGR